MKRNKNVTSSSGNVFADLGLPNPEERLAKAELARQINNIIKERKLTQTAAAALLDIDQPKISALSTGKLTGFSLDRLFRFLNSLDQNITIKVTPRARSKKHAEITVSVPPVRRSSIGSEGGKAKKIPLKKQPAQKPSLTIHARKKK
jgi:predicted XRE-type DNA-binding protein